MLYRLFWKVVYFFTGSLLTEEEAQSCLAEMKTFGLVYQGRDGHWYLTARGEKVMRGECDELH